MSRMRDEVHCAAESVLAMPSYATNSTTLTLRDTRLFSQHWQTVFHTKWTTHLSKIHPSASPEENDTWKVQLAVEQFLYRKQHTQFGLKINEHV